MLAIGNDELGDTVKKGDKVTNDDVMTGFVEYSTDLNGKELDIVGAIKIGKDSYLVSIRGRLLSGWRKCDE